MKNLPTDLKILTEIYERYYEEFKNFSREEPTRDCKVYVPIDIRAIASHLNTDEYITFGRLYNHLSKKYEFKDSNGASSPLFKFEGHEIHFPLLASILAGMQEENKRQLKTWKISVAAIIISGIIGGFTVFKIFYDIKIESHRNTQGCEYSHKSQVTKSAVK